jgi:hypothetical protein
MGKSPVMADGQAIRTIVETGAPRVIMRIG